MANWRGLLIIASCYALAFTDRQILNLMVEHMREDFGINDAQVGFLLGPAFSLSYTALGLLAGYLADRRNRRNLLVFAGAVWSLATIASGFASSYETMIATRVMVGASEAFLFPSCMSLVADLFDRRRLPLATTVFLICPYIGGGVAMIAGGLIVGLTADMPPIDLVIGTLRNWQVSLVVMGVVGAFPVLLLLTIEEPARARSDEQGQDAQTFTFWEGTLYMLRRWRFFLFFFVGVVFICLMLHGVPSWSPTIFIREYGMTAREVGLSYGILTLVCGIGGGLSAPVIERWLAKRYPDSTFRVVMIGPAIMAAAAIALWFAANPLATFIFVGLISVGYCMALPMAGVSLQLATPPRLRGQVASFYFVALNLFGLGFGPLLVPWTAEAIFGDPRAIAKSISVATVSTTAVAIVLLYIARGEFVRRLHRKEI